MDPYYKTHLGKLYNVDALYIAHHIESESYNLIVTDPPYTFSMSSSCTGKISPWADMINSSTFFSAWIKEGMRIVNKHGALWTFCNWKTFPSITKGIIDAGYKIESVLVWNKECFGTGTLRGLRSVYELVVLVCNEDYKIKNRSLPDICTYKWPSLKPSGHPAEKPLGLIRWLIEISEAKSVCDLFLGSGTTAVACENLGVEWLGFELSKKICDMAIKRIEAESSQAKLF